MVKKGVFITLEGGEGSGKSTLLRQLATEIANCGYEIVTTREPGGSKLSEEIRQLLLNKNEAFKIGAKAELLLFLAARAQHIEEIIAPALKEGKVVLCDRFNDSTLAYQGAARGIKEEEIKLLCKLVCGEIQPNMTLFLDVDPAIGLKRTNRIAKENAHEGQYDRIEAEKLEFHERVRQGFLSIVKSEPSRVIRLDADRPQLEVFEEAKRVVFNRLTG